VRNFQEEPLLARFNIGSLRLQGDISSEKMKLLVGQISVKWKYFGFIPVTDKSLKHVRK